MSEGYDEVESISGGWMVFAGERAPPVREAWIVAAIPWAAGESEPVVEAPPSVEAERTAASEPGAVGCPGPSGLRAVANPTTTVEVAKAMAARPR
jgi:hypothetical protein